MRLHDLVEPEHLPNLDMQLPIGHVAGQVVARRLHPHHAGHAGGLQISGNVVLRDCTWVADTQTTRCSCRRTMERLHPRAG